MADENFYKDMPSFTDFADICEGQRYHPVPDSWDLVITDVQGSTKAIEAGRYKDVNSLGVASIVVVRNAMPEVQLPFVFGGDGATILTPSSRRDDLYRALRQLRSSSKECFDLSMRVGVVPVAKLRAEGHEIEVSRFAASPHVTFAMMRGSGLDVGEEWVKDPLREAEFHVSDEGPVDGSFEGFSCRWNPVPARNGLAVSLIVKAMYEDPDQRSEVYRRVLVEIDKLVQVIDGGRPVSTKTLSFKKPDGDHDAELKLRTQGSRGEDEEAVRKNIRKQSRIARLLTATGVSAGGFAPKRYKKELVANTDFRKFDNVLRMHLDLRPGQLATLKSELQKAEDDGHLVYGIHTADHTLMTCVVDSYQGSHAHFVDGAAGGYALAAKRIKALLREKPSES